MLQRFMAEQQGLNERARLDREARAAQAEATAQTGIQRERIRQGVDEQAAMSALRIQRAQEEAERIRLLQEDVQGGDVRQAAPLLQAQGLPVTDENIQAATGIPDATEYDPNGTTLWNRIFNITPEGNPRIPYAPSWAYFRNLFQ